MRTQQSGDRFDSKRLGKDRSNKAKLSTRNFTRSNAHGKRTALETFSRIFICALPVARAPATRTGAQSAPEWHLPDIPWAFPIRDKVPPILDERKGPQHI